MSPRRTSFQWLLAGVLSAAGMFVWSTIAHMALPLGDAGVRQIPGEAAVLGPLQATLGPNSGLYLYPGWGEAGGDMEQYARKLAVSPSGLLIYHPPGATGMSGGTLFRHFLTQLAQALLAVFLLIRANRPGYLERAAFILVIGAIAAIAANVPYWNWYGFPGTYTASQIAMLAIEYLVAGLIAAAIVKPSAA